MTGLSETMREPGIVRTPVRRFHHGQTVRQSTGIESVKWNRNSEPAGQTSPLTVTWESTSEGVVCEVPRRNKESDQFLAKIATDCVVHGRSKG